ncbi:MAG: hypothetical protein MZV64_17075 [Ignavibacteriales bacterium]|nr:hypothetical protein [Ignavibacteriales bacterium]
MDWVRTACASPRIRGGTQRDDHRTARRGGIHHPAWDGEDPYRAGRTGCDHRDIGRGRHARRDEPDRQYGSFGQRGDAGELA